MTLAHRLLIALLGSLLTVAPSATVEVVVETDAPRDDAGEPKEDGPRTIRSVRPVVLKDLTRRDVGLRIESEDAGPDPEPDGPAEADASLAPAFPRLPAIARTAPQPPRAASRPAADTRAGLLGLPPPTALSV